jgi:hypothetical protein
MVYSKATRVTSRIMVQSMGTSTASPLRGFSLDCYRSRSSCLGMCTLFTGMSAITFDEDLEAVGENPEKDDEILDYSWRALHSTTVQVKSLVEKYYERNWTKSYFSGCGSGGRQGIKAMATFPEDYDGLL